MGGTQSKQLSNKCDSSTQTPFLVCQYTNGREPLRRSSTFTSSSEPVSTSSASVAAARVVKDMPLQSPQSKRPKYAPVYVLWKNSIEDQQTCKTRKVPPIKEKSQRSLNIPGVVAGQLIPDGFPAYTELAPSMSRKEETNCEDMEEKSAIKMHRRALHMSMRRAKSFAGNISEQQATVQVINQKNIIADYGTTLNADNDYPEDEMDEADSSETDDEVAFAGLFPKLRHKSHSFGESQIRRSLSPRRSPTPERNSPVLLHNLSYDMRRSYYYL